MPASESLNIDGALPGNDGIPANLEQRTGGDQTGANFIAPGADVAEK